MKPEEYVTTIVYRGKMINIGNDDAGQQFFLEYVDDATGNLVETGCGAYDTNYMELIESFWGDTSECEHYGFGICHEHLTDHGYCFRCPYNPRFIESNLRMRKKK